ncbi:RuvC-like resolvase [Gordonia phage Dalilpop]|nr:RuvC-like resolvase [Gordonia phage Dalilpop]
MKPHDTPEHWFDRRAIFHADEGYPDPLEERLPSLSNAMIANRMKRGVNVVAFDPGGTTGWSVFTLDVERLFDKTVRAHEVITDWWHGEIDCGAASGQLGSAASQYDLSASEEGEAAGAHLCEKLVERHAQALNCTVVVEDFILRTQNQKRDALSPVRITAILDYLLWEGKNVPYPIARQQPSEAKTAITDERLKLWDMWVPGGRHARDADRHALLFVRKVREQRTKIFKAWPLLAEANKRDMLGLRST